MRNYKRPETPILLNVSELFARDIQLKIPTWQREYSWDADEEVRLLLEDLDKFANSEEFNYVLGSIITYPNKDGSHSVVDGQQRSVTLYVLIVALRDVLEKRLLAEHGAVNSAPEGFKVLHQTVDGLVRKISIDAKAEISLPIYMEYGEGNQMLTSLAIKSPAPSGILTASQSNISAAYLKCRDFLDETYKDSKALAEFTRAVIFGTFIVETNVGDQRQALDIFFKMNARGRDLDSSDYLKNYMFQQLTSDKYDDVSDKWSAMSKALRSTETSRAKLKTPEFFLRNWAIVDRGEKISGDQGVWEYWRGKIEANPDYLDIFLNNIESQAEVFSKITSNKMILNKSENKEMVGADYFKGTQYLPVLLAGAPLVNYQYLSSVVNYRYLIYILAQERTQDFETLVPRWAKQISTLSSGASVEGINTCLQNVPSLCLDKAGLETLRMKLQDLSMPKDERKIRAVLAIASLQVSEKYADLTEYLKKYRAPKKYGFDIDLILNRDEIGELVNDPSDLEYRRYMSLGNVALVNFQGKHFENKKPFAKEELYGADKSPITQALSSHPEKHDPDSNAQVMKFRQNVATDLSTFNLSQIEDRRDAIINKFLEAIPKVLLQK